MTSELSCKELTQLITEYLEGVLSSTDRERFESHLSRCPGCITYIEQMQETVKQLGNMPSVEIPSNLESSIVDAFRAWKKAD